MFLLRIANFFRGYIVISIEGFFLERFLNICTNRNIYLWDIKRRGDRRMTACISIGGFKRIATVAYKASCRVKLLKRYGCPFVLFRHRKRYSFLIGIALFIAGMITMSSFIWGIEVIGNENLTRGEIIQALTDSGLTVGSMTGGINKDDIKSKMMISMPEIGWIGINIAGTKATVEIKERNPMPVIVDKTKAYNIKAKYDGVIETLDVKSGIKMVKEGDVVTSGQIIVSGIMDSKVEGVRYLFPSAELEMKTWREVSAEILQYMDVEERTGNEKAKHIIQLFGHNINLFWDDKVYFEHFERISDVKQPSVGENFLLPFSFHYDKFYETEFVRQDITPEEAYNNCVENLRKQLSEKLETDTVIINENLVQKTDDQGRQILTLIYECRDKAVIMEEIQRE